MNKLIISIIAFMLLVLPVSALEIRGTVHDGNGDFEWDANSFAAFYYDIDKNIKSETLTATVSGRTISEGNLKYTTNKVFSEYKVHKEEGLDVNGNPEYGVIGWQGEKYITIGSNANKVTKLLYEMDSDDKITLVSGQNFVFGNGYELIINSVDARSSPRQVWLTFSKNGVPLDEIIMGQKEVYTYTTTILGTEDTSVFSIYTDRIFSGTSSDMVQLKYGWLMDKDASFEIKTDDSFGVFEVTKVDSNSIELTNDDTVSLSQNTETTIMGDLKFRVADSDILRFYPKIDVETFPIELPCIPTIVKQNVSVPKVEPVATPSFVTPIPVPIETPPPSPTIVPTASPEPIPKPTTKKSPGFEVIYTIFGIFCVIAIAKKH